MKVLYLSDNRVRGNYGCRATSTALSMLIREHHEITGVITGKYTHNDLNNLFFNNRYPSFIYSLIGRNSHLNTIRRLHIKMACKMLKKSIQFSSFDFISLDMEKSIKNLKKAIPANPHLKEFDIDQYDFDALVVNGEGSFIFSNPIWRESMIMSMIIYWSLKKGKKVFFMNAMFSDMPDVPRNIKTLKLVNSLLSKCNVVVAREDISYKYVKDNLPDVNPILIPDALFSWYNLINDDFKVTNYRYVLPHVDECDDAYNWDFTQPYVLIAGSSQIRSQEDAAKAYTNLVKKLQIHFKGNIYLIQVCEGDYFLKMVSDNTGSHLISLETPILAAAKILANARCFISGRYHPAIMASIGGTPCVFMGSNSHKTYSLQLLLKYNSVKEYNQIPSETDCDAMIEDALNAISKGDELRKTIKSRAFELYTESRKTADLIK